MKKTYFFFTEVEGKKAFTTVEYENNEAAIAAAKADATVYKVNAADGGQDIWTK